MIVKNMQVLTLCLFYLTFEPNSPLVREMKNVPLLCLPHLGEQHCPVPSPGQDPGQHPRVLYLHPALRLLRRPNNLPSPSAQSYCHCPDFNTQSCLEQFPNLQSSTDAYTILASSVPYLCITLP